ncbi:kinesin-related protein 4 [Copidosoma floridanum]|uniref:kinesin-related protein 4 n=1 Tax=Copidosoma floridanum TaxID=29053 RepID=UPI0006C944E7|nr:kinesin-related protein 4 [Copidosoma floridanum]
MQDSIQVAIKVRPLIKREIDDNLKSQWTVVDKVIAPVDPEIKRGDCSFQFDHIFDPKKTNVDVFETVVRPIVDAAVKGFNGTVFAYGQTSSGKTHTMLGTLDEPGVTPLAIDRMFDAITETCGREFLLRVSYLEIYNEKVNDLLDTSGMDLKLREDNNGLVQVLKSKEEIASSPDLIMSIMKKGDKNRRIGETNMNERSSRSHTIFRITIESRDQSSDSDGAIQVSQLNLVDLAGSERASQTNATGERFKEGTHINMSLSTLGLVIKQLSESSDNTKYVNFRDSKLTRLLQASLGGNAMTAIICAVTPAAFEETLCTLGFASRAKSVKNKPQLNEVMSDAALLKRYKRQIAKLNEELERLKHEKGFPDVQEIETKLQEKEHILKEKDRINLMLEERIELLKNSIVSTSSVTRDDNRSKIPKSLRRRTWAGNVGPNFRLSLGFRNLPTIVETSCTSENTSNSNDNICKNVNRRKSYIQTVDLNEESFETEFTDFELELIKVAKEREILSDTTYYQEEKISGEVAPKTEKNRVKFEDDVVINYFNNGSSYCDASTPEKRKYNSNNDQNQDSSPGTPKAILRERINYLTEEFKELRQFTTLEKQVLRAEKLNFDLPDDEILDQQSKIDDLTQALEMSNKYQAQIEEKLTVSINCINELCLKVPDVYDLWKPLISEGKKADPNNTVGDLNQLLEILKNSNNQQNGTTASNALHEQLTNDYNECVKKLESVESHKKSLIKENSELKSKLAGESTKLQSMSDLVKSLKNDTDCLMEKLIQKNDELIKIKDRVVELERIHSEFEKSTLTSISEDFLEKETESNVPTKLDQVLSNEVAKMDENDQWIEVSKYKNLEEEMKLENERLQQVIDEFTNRGKKSVDSQTESVSNDISNDTQILKLSELIEEKTSSIANYQQIEIEMKEKIVQLQSCLEKLDKKDNLSEQSSSENAVSCDKDSNLILKQQQEELSKTIEEIETLPLLVDNRETIIGSEEPKFDKDKLIFDVTESNLKVVTLEAIIEEKNKEIEKLKQLEEYRIKEIESLKLQLNDSHDSKQTEDSQVADIPDSCNNKTSELLEVIELKSSEIKKYQESEEELKKEISRLKDSLEDMEKIIKEHEKSIAKKSSEKVSQEEVNQEKDDEILKLKEDLQEKILDIEKYKQTEKELNSKISRLQESFDDLEKNEKVSEKSLIESQGSDETHRVNMIQEKDVQISNLSEIIREKSLEIEQLLQSEQEKSKEIEDLKQRLESDQVLSNHVISDGMEVMEVGNIEMGTGDCKVTEINRLHSIIAKKSLEITNYQDSEQKMKKEIERLRQRLDDASREYQTSQLTQKEKATAGDEKETDESKMRNQIKTYLEEIETLRQDVDATKIESEKFEASATSLRDEVTANIKEIDELKSLNSDLKKIIDEKTTEITSLNRDFENKFEDLEKKHDVILLERDELKEKLDSVISTELNEGLENEIINLQTVIENLRADNHHLRKRVEALDTEFNKSTSMKSCMDTMCDSAIALESEIKEPINETVKQEVDTKSMEVSSFIKPENTRIEIKESKPTPVIPSTPVTGSDDKKPLSQLELETSSIFANNTYFDNLEDGQSIVHDSASMVAGFDVSNMTESIDALKIKKEMVQIPDDSLRELTQDVTNTEKSVIIPTGIIRSSSLDQTVIESYTVDELKDFVTYLKQTLVKFEATVDTLWKDNENMSTLLTKEKKSNIMVINDLQKKIDALNEQLEKLTQEKVSLQRDLEITTEQFEAMRSKTPILHDDEIKQEILRYQDKVKSLNEENVNLMEKIGELEKVKESKLHEYDHHCVYREKADSLLEEYKCLENENIELSNGLTNQIEECDRLTMAVDVLKKQLEAYTNQSTHESSDKIELDILKADNEQLTNEVIEMRTKINQLSNENAYLSSNLVLDDSDEHNASTVSLQNKSSRNFMGLEMSISDDPANELTNASSRSSRVKFLESKVEELTCKNKKLSELKLMICSSCSELKELNENRRHLKVQLKSVQHDLLNLQKDFKKKCVETEALKVKAREDFNSSLNSTLMDDTLNTSSLDGSSVALIEEKILELRNAYEELKENHSKLANQYKESNVLDKSQIEKSSPVVPDRKSRKNVSKIQALQKNIEILENEIQDMKKSNSKVYASINQFLTEKGGQIEVLQVENGKLKKEHSDAQASVLTFAEKAKLLEEELTGLYKRIDSATAAEKEIHAEKLEIEVRLESLINEKSELIKSHQDAQEKLMRELEDCKSLLCTHEKEIEELKSDLARSEALVNQSKGQNSAVDVVQEEISQAKSRIIKEIVSLDSLSEDESKALSKKTLIQTFQRFYNAVLSKQTEIVKRFQDEYEKSKRKLTEEKQQCIDAEKRAIALVQTMESDLEKFQTDVTEQEKKNRKLEEEKLNLEHRFKEAQHENERLHSAIRILESDLSQLQLELEKKSRSNEDRDSAISAAQEREKLAKAKEEESENRLMQEKEERRREVSKLNDELDSYKSLIDDLKNSVEGLELEIEHLKNTNNIKTNDLVVVENRIAEFEQVIAQAEEVIQQLKNESLEKDRCKDELQNLLKIKCDLLTEYKTKVETMKPEFESLQAQLADRKLYVEKCKEDIHNMKLEHNKQLDVWQDKISNEEIKSAGLGKQIAELKNKNTQLCSTIEDLKDRCTEIERENASLQRKVRNSTSKVRVENEMQELQDENRLLKNHLEGSYNRIKELQETKSQVQREMAEAQGKKELLEQELNTTKIALESLREKYNNINLQKMRERYETLLQEKNNVVREVEEKRMLLASKDQKLVEYSIELDTLKKQKEMLNSEILNSRVEKSSLENKITNVNDEIEKLKVQLNTSIAEKDEVYRLFEEEKCKSSLELQSNRIKIDELVKKNKELDEEMDDMVSHVHKLENENVELFNKMIEGSCIENLEKIKNLENERERLQTGLQATEGKLTKLENEIIRLNSEKEQLLSKIEDMNGKYAELESKFFEKMSSRGGSRSNSPSSRKKQGRQKRSDLFNLSRTLNEGNDNQDVTENESPTSTPTPPPILLECHMCNELKNRIREMSLDIVSKSNKITMLEVQLQSENLPYQIKYNELQQHVLALKTRNSELKLEAQKLQRALMEDSFRECRICRQRKLNKRDQAVQANVPDKLYLSGMSSGAVEDYCKIVKLEKERNIMKDLCRNRAKKIKELEFRIRDFEGLNAIKE